MDRARDDRPGAVTAAGRAERPAVRVLQVLHRLSVDGGVQVAVRTLAAAVDPGEVELHVVTARPAVAADRLDEVPATVWTLDHRRDRYRWWDRVRVAWGVARVARLLRPDVLHLHSGTTWMAALAAARVPSAAVVVEVHDAPGSGRHAAGTDRLERAWFVRHSTTALCHSSAVAAEVARRWRIRPERVAVVPLAVDADRFRPMSPADRRAWRSAHGISERTTLVAVVGRLVPSKRIDVVLDAAGRLLARGRDVAVVVVGDGPLAEELRQLAARSLPPGAVWFTGRVDDDELVTVLGSSDLACSASEYEGFGLSTVEAMACGLPVVATAVGGSTEVVDDGVTGVLVPAGDPAALADALDGLATDPERRRRMGCTARERAVRDYGPVAMGQQVAAWYRSAAQPTAGAGGRDRGPDGGRL